MKLKNQVFTSIIVSCLLPLAIAFIYAIWHSYDTTNQLVLSSVEQRLKVSSERLNSYFNARKAEISLLAIQPSVKAMNFINMRSDLLSVLALKSHYYEKFIVGLPNGHFYNTAGGNPQLNMLRTSDDSSASAKPKSIKKRDYWQQTLGIKDPDLSAVYLSNPMISYTTEVKQVVVAQTVFDQENNAVGLIAGALPWQNIQNIINTIQQELTHEFDGMVQLALISRDGTYWYHWQPDKVIRFDKNANGEFNLTERGEKKTLSSNINEIFPQSAEAIFSLVAEGDFLHVNKSLPTSDVHHLFLPVGDTGYILQLQVDDSVLSLPSVGLIKILLLILLVASATAMIITFITAKSLTQPLLRFTEKIQRLTGHNIQPISFKSNTEEFNQLVAQFNLLVAALIDNQNSLSNSKQRFSLAMQGANDGLWDWNLVDNTVYFSPRWKEMLGYKDGELDNDLVTWQKLMAEDDRETTLQAVQNYLEGKSSSYRHEFKMLHKNGNQVDILARGVGAKDEQGKFIRMVGTHLDITEHNQQKSLLREANDTLEDKVNARTAELKVINKQLVAANIAADSASKAKSLFLANMSHEIRTPMNGIIGLTELLQRTVLDEEQRSFITKLQYSSNNLLHLLNDILDISKIEAGKLSIEAVDFDFIDMLTSVINIVEVKAKEKNITLTVNVEDNFQTKVVGDSVRCSQVLANLLSNAIKFTEQGGVTLTISRAFNDEHIQVEVTDTGIGISAEQQKKLFSNFTQADDSTSRKYGGTGLGLTICKHLVQLMQGDIKLRSELGKGSTFSFDLWLPVAKKQRKTEPTNIPEKSYNKDYLCEKLVDKTVLLVEDVAINRLVAEKILSQAGLKVDFAVNGKDAVKKVNDKQYDLIVMDIQMPEMDGYQATKIIRKMDNYALTPIIAMTANAMSDDRDLCLAAGMNSHLTKPIKADEVINELASFFSK